MTTTSKNYNAAVPVFEELCSREHNQEACVGLGLAYRDGKGKPVDLNKAIQLFSEFSDYIYAKLFLAQLYEYGIGDVDSMNKAYSLYEDIGKTGDNDLEKPINDAFVRLPVYKFIVEFTDYAADLRNGKISYDTFCNLTSNMNLSELPPEISSSFLAYLPKIQESNEDFVSGFIRGFINPLQAAKEVYNSVKGVQKRDSKILFDKFISSLDKYKISIKFYNNQTAKMK